MKNKFSRFQRYFLLVLFLPVGHSFLSVGHSKVFTDYTFGDDMMKFVRDSVYRISDAHIKQDYPSRSLIAFQVTLDKARAATNNAIASLNQSVALLDSMQKGVQFLLDAGAGNTSLSSERIARLAEYSTTVNLILNSIAYNKETVLANARALVWLDQPITYKEFVEQGLYLVPYIYIMSSISGAPDFNSTIAFTYTVSNDGASTNGSNTTNGLLSFINFLFNKDEEEEYEEQMDKYRDALNLIPKKIPDTPACYEIYKNGFLFAQKLFGNEPQLLRTHIDSIAYEINARHVVLLDLKGAIENGLLSDRVRHAFRSLGEHHFNASARTAIKNRLLQIKAARDKVLNKRLNIPGAGNNKANIMIALEDMHETCMTTESFIKETDSLLLFQPVHHLLPEQLRWFSKQRYWATQYLQTGQIPSDSTVTQQKLTSKTNKAKAFDLKQTSSVLKLATMAGDPYPSLSIGYNWPGGGSGAYYQLYPYSGISIWERNADGAFPADNRRVGFYPGAVSANLRQRTTDLGKKHEAALGRVRQDAPARQQEIRQQANLNQSFRRQTAVARTIIPAGHNPVRVPEPTPTPYRDLDPQYTQSEVQLPVIINTETRRQNILMNSLPGDVSSSVAAQRYRKLHDQYLDYTYGLWAGGFFKEAERMLSGAQSLRAQFQGFADPAQPLPSFEPPDIPFSPFTKDDHTLILGRNLDYQTVNNNLRSKTRWFEAAAIVTQLNGIGLTDALAATQGFGFSLTADFLRQVNQELYQNNMLNAVKIQAGRMDGSFRAANGETVSFKGLSGKELDYALVKYEQTKVEEHLNAYRRGHSLAEIATVVGQINLFMHSMNRLYILPAEVRAAMFSSFNFARYEDRVRLGQAIIDELYKKPE